MQAKTVKQGLIAVKWMLKNIGWCQQRYYQDSEGENLGLYDVQNFLSSAKKVCSMCLEGAIELVEVDDERVRGGMYDALDAVLDARYGKGNLTRFNDLKSTSKGDVLDVVDQAIKES
jgi:hypothetical protein